MHIKSIVAGAAIALASTVGSASAADQFSTLEGVTADAMTPQEMGVVTGAAAARLDIATPGPFPTFPIGIDFPVAAGASGVLSALPSGTVAGGCDICTFTPET